VDSAALVGSQINDGGLLLELLEREGLGVTAAAWLRPTDGDRWMLYIVSEDINKQGSLAAYQKVADALGKLSNSWFSISDVKLVGGGDSVAKALEDVLAKKAHRAASSELIGFGNLSFDEMYLYPSSKCPHTELTDSQKDVLERLFFLHRPPSVDDLPYTDEMEAIHDEFVRDTGLALTTRDVFKALKNLGRQGRLGGSRSQNYENDSKSNAEQSAVGV